MGDLGVVGLNESEYFACVLYCFDVSLDEFEQLIDSSPLINSAFLTYYFIHCDHHLQPVVVLADYQGCDEV